MILASAGKSLKEEEQVRLLLQGAAGDFITLVFVTFLFFVVSAESWPEL